MTTPAAATQPAIPCEKCKTGTMWQTRVPKFSEGLRLIGFTIWIPSLMLLAGATVLYLMMLVVSGTATVATVADPVTPPLNERLEHIAGLSPSFIEAAKDGTIEVKDWNLVTDEAKPQAREVVDKYEAEVAVKAIGTAGGMLGTVAAGGIGGCGLVFTYLILVPAFIIGLVLTMKRSVWKCTNCGFIYDRA